MMTSLKRRIKSRKGFTLLELIAVIAIIAVLAAVAIPQYTKTIERGRISAGQAWLGGFYTAYQAGISSGRTITLPDNPAALEMGAEMGDTTIYLPPKEFTYSAGGTVIILTRDATPTPVPTFVLDGVEGVDGITGAYTLTLDLNSGKITPAPGA